MRNRLDIMPFRGEQKMAENIDDEALYEEAQDIASWESGFRKLPKYKQEARIEKIMADMKLNMLLDPCKLFYE